MHASGIEGIPWWKRAVFYQIYPRSFYDSNGDGIGDLPGIAAKLDYVASLGVDAIWLSPFFRSPMKDFGYDVSDYRNVDPLFGTLQDFDRLLEEAHRLGLKLIIDQVWSHTSDQHSWFKASAARRDGFDDWYVWADAKPDGTPPNNWQASFGGPAWTWHPGRRQYYLHNFLSSQPDLNFHCAAVQDAILDAARFWLDRGVDGFRLDVINYVAHDRALRDNPTIEASETPAATIRFQRQLHNKSQPEALVFVARLRALLDSYKDRFAVGEIFDDDMLARQIEYTDGPERLHTAYSFHLLNARRATPQLFATAMEAWRGTAGWPSWSLSNHDVPRAATRLAQDDETLSRLLLAVLLALPGTPFLYQGEELGLPQSQVPFDRLKDPFAIAAWTEAEAGAGRDGARTPIPWEAGRNHGGFSSADACWLPADPAHLPRAVDMQDGVEGSFLAFVRDLIAVLKAQPALQAGEYCLIEASASLLAFERRLDDDHIVCVFNFTDAAQSFDLKAVSEHRLIHASGGASIELAALDLPAFGWAFVS